MVEFECWGCGGLVGLHLTGCDSVPEHASDEITGIVAAAINLAGFEFDIEAGEESGDAVVGEAALTQDLDFASEEFDYLISGEALFVSACSFAKLTSCDCNLIDAVGACA